MSASEVVSDPGSGAQASRATVLADGPPLALPCHDETLSCEADARAALISACRSLNARGVNQGKAGNASVRWDRGARAGLLVTPSALPYDQMTPADIVWLSMDLAQVSALRDTGPMPVVIDSNGRRPSSEWRIHRDLYLHRPDAAAVVHAHSPHATALACLPAVQSAGIPAFHYMVAVAGGVDIRCAPYATFGTQALSDLALQALNGRRACLLAHHGTVALGGSLAAALALAEELETLARMYHLACQLGPPAVLPDDEMHRVLALFADYRPDQPPAAG